MTTESTRTSTRLGLVHGFTQTSQCWGRLGDRLARDTEIVLIDAPGHGVSADLELDLWGGAAMIAERLGRGTLLGYSLGGRLALHTTLAHPDAVDRLVLISATAGIDDPAARTARRDDDEQLARHLELIGVGPFIDEWLARPMFARLPRSGDCEAARRSNTVAGLSASLRRCGVGAQDPLWDRLAEIQVPTLLIAGALDTKFVNLAERLADSISLSALEVIADAGHACHLERPDEVADIVEHWINGGSRSAGSSPA